MKRVLIAALFVLLGIIVFTAAVFFINRNPGEGGLQVTSQPKSRVYLNGKYIGETPLLKQKPEETIKAGEYKIRLVSEDPRFDPFENKILINPKTLTVVDRTFNEDGAESGSIITLAKLSDKNATELEIISFPDKAKIFLDNNATGFSPILLKNLTESDHEIKLTRDGYQDKTIRVRTVKGFRLEALVFLGISPTLEGNGESEAEVKVSQVLILQTPTGFLRVREDATTASSEIGRVSPGEKYDLLEEQNSWYKIKFKNQEGWISSQYAQKN